MSLQPNTRPIVRDRAGHDYRTLLVHVQPGLAGAHRVELAAGLARRFQARLIGLGAESHDPMVFADPSAAHMSAVYEELQARIDADLEAAEAAFRRDAAGGDMVWRLERSAPAVAMARAARAADLIITSADEARSGDRFVALDPRDIVMTSGRPVLVAPSGDGHLSAERILVAWKDVREARRALSDALPFLVRAQEVQVMTVCESAELEDSQAAAEDVAAALRRHGVPATAQVRIGSDADVAQTLNASASAMGADLIVAGAYGHSRMLEWVLGGVTDSLLRRPERYLLLSH